MSKQFNTRIQHKIDTYENWNKAENFIPLKGEIIIYTTNEKGEAETKIKIGDGTTNVNDLEFAVAGSASGETSTSAIQSDWAQTDTTKLDYIKNKPEIGINIEENSSKLATSGAVFEAIKKIASAGGIAYEAGKLTKIENNKISSTLGDKLSETFEIPVWEDFGVLDLVFQPDMSTGTYIPKEMALNPEGYMLSHLKLGTAPIHDLSVIEMYDPAEEKTYLLDATMATAIDSDGMELIVGYNLNVDLNTGEFSAIDDTKPMTAIFYMYLAEDKTSYIYLPVTLMDYTGWSYKLRKVTPIISLENISVSYDTTPFEGFYVRKSYSVNLSAIENNKDSLFFSIKTSDGLNIEKQINLVDFPGSLLGNPDDIYPAFFINATNSSMAEFISSGLIKEDSQYVSGAMGFASNSVMIILDSNVVIESISIYSKDKSESYVYLPDTAIATDDYLEYIGGKLQSTLGETRIRTIDVPYFNKIINIDTVNDNTYTYTEYSSDGVTLLPYWLENQPITIEINHNNETYVYQEELVYSTDFAGSEIPINVICMNTVETAEEMMSNNISTITPKDPNKPAFAFAHMFIPGYGSSFMVASLNEMKNVHINAIVHETKETIVSIPDRAIRGENYIEYKNGIIKTTLGDKKFTPVTRTLVNSTFSGTLAQNGLYMWDYPIEDNFTLQDLKFHLYDSNEKIVFYENMQLTYNPELDEMLSSLIGYSFSNGVYGVLNSSSTPLEILSTGQIPLINESYRYGFICGITYISGEATFVIASIEDLAEVGWGFIVTDIIEEIYTEKLPSSLIQMNIGKGLIDNGGILENSYGRIINYTKSPQLTSFYSSFLNEYVDENGELYYMKELASYDTTKLYNSSAKAFAIDFYIDDDNYSIIAPVEQGLGIKLCEFNFIHNNNLYNLTFVIMSSAAYIISKYKYSTTFSFYELTNLEYEKIPVEALPDNIGGGKVSSVNGQTGDVILSAIDVGALPETTTTIQNAINAENAATVNGYKIKFASEPPSANEVDEFTLTFVI